MKHDQISSSFEQTQFTSDISKFLDPNAVPQEDVVRAWRPLKDAMPKILESFYSVILDTPFLAAKMGPHAKDTAPLVKAQIAHWEYIFTHRPDLQFESHAAKIGAAHVRIGLSGPWLMAAFGHLISDAIPYITQKYRFSPSKLDKALQALISRFFLDMILAQKAFEEGTKLQTNAKEETDRNLLNLRNVADRISELNELSMSMAMLSRNSRDANQSSQAISAAAEELVRSIQQISQNSADANREAAATNSAAIEGLNKMSAVSKSISEIATTSSETSNSLTELHEASEQISEFLAVIESIANQTNLLALNATIEAARAGEAGKGFAVVAAEVKSLATQTAKATEDIARRIEALQAGMNTIQSSIDSSHSAVSRGQEAMQDANTLMDTIGGQISAVSERITDISSILQQQEDTSQEIAQSISQVASMSQDNDERLTSMYQTLQTSNDSYAASAKEWFSPDAHRSLCEMAKIDHILLKKRVVDTITGREDWSSADLPDHHSCRLGQWYDSIESQEIRNHPAFQSMDAPHQRVHSAALKALQAREANDMPAAFRHLADVESASQEVIECLNVFSEALENELASADKRGFPRHPGKGVAKVSGKDGKRELKVGDISRSGMNLIGLTKKDIGELIHIDHDGKKLIGEVVWSDGTKGGVKFLMNGEQK